MRTTPFYELGGELAEVAWHLDTYLLGSGADFGFICVDCWFHEMYPANRVEVERLLATLHETRLAPFLRRAGLHGELSDLPEEQFRERVLRFRYYLAEPDEPSEEVFNRLGLVMQMTRPLQKFLQGELNMLELKRMVRPLQKSLAMAAPELHPLLYSIAEQMSLVGEQTPEDTEQLRQELRWYCAHWLCRLHSYWHAVLG